MDQVKEFSQRSILTLACEALHDLAWGSIQFHFLALGLSTSATLVLDPPKATLRPFHPHSLSISWSLCLVCSFPRHLQGLNSYFLQASPQMSVTTLEKASLITIYKIAHSFPPLVDMVIYHSHPLSETSLTGPSGAASSKLLLQVAVPLLALSW